MNRAELISAVIGALLAYYVVAHFLNTGKPA